MTGEESGLAAHQESGHRDTASALVFLLVEHRQNFMREELKKLEHRLGAGIVGHWGRARLGLTTIGRLLGFWVIRARQKMFEGPSTAR